MNEYLIKLAYYHNININDFANEKELQKEIDRIEEEKVKQEINKAMHNIFKK